MPDSRLLIASLVHAASDDAVTHCVSPASTSSASSSAPLSASTASAAAAAAAAPHASGAPVSIPPLSLPPLPPAHFSSLLPPPHPSHPASPPADAPPRFAASGNTSFRRLSHPHCSQPQAHLQSQPHALLPSSSSSHHHQSSRLNSHSVPLSHPLSLSSSRAPLYPQPPPPPATAGAASNAASTSPQTVIVKTPRGKRHRCTYTGCGRDFSRLSNLKAHWRRHSGEEPYACMHCTRKFKWRSSLKSHELGCVYEFAKSNNGLRLVYLGSTAPAPGNHRSSNHLAASAADQAVSSNGGGVASTTAFGGGGGIASDVGTGGGGGGGGALGSHLGSRMGMGMGMGMGMSLGMGMGMGMGSGFVGVSGGATTDMQPGVFLPPPVAGASPSRQPVLPFPRGVV